VPTCAYLYLQDGGGTVFKITSAGAFTSLHSFSGFDGSFPQDVLVQGSDGNFYGTTTCGGTPNLGTAFKMTPAGTLTSLHFFDGAHGANPFGGLVQATDGNFYGTTYSGGTSTACPGGCGTVFVLHTGLGPFVETVPTSRPVGQSVRILGNNLSGATSVTFNGVSAAFTVASRSQILTTVPVGASSGTVQVITPAGTLLSNVPFAIP
jgi:uncharacterized repeat protein (TIGR03803 family)